MPKVSVILPVYNGAEFLKEAIDSILAQTFVDFELLILNDGSTDNTENIILDYTDARITYHKNETNSGLIYTLNKGIDLSSGEYIARMDADDIALPQRFEEQIDYLLRSDAAVLATTVQLIDEKNNFLENWKEDRLYTTHEEIKKYIKINNCIAHPSVMGRASVFKTYKYQHNQKYSEDYDLWLRLIAANHRIEKLNEPLLYHRILPTSVTRFTKKNVFFRIGKVKLRFVSSLLSQGRFSHFAFSVFSYALLDFLKGAGKEIKSIFSK